MLQNTLNVIEVFEPAPHYWQVILERPDGRLHGHAMPKTTLAARSIEYGVHEDDEETLWDMVIHEPFMVEPSDNLMVARWGDPAKAVGLEGETCYTAQTLQHAKAAHAARVEHCKAEIVVVRDKRAKRKPVVKHREHWQTCALIEDRFWSERRTMRAALREATRGAAQR